MKGVLEMIGVRAEHRRQHKNSTPSKF